MEVLEMLWECAANVGKKGRINISTLSNRLAQETFGEFGGVFLYEKQGLLHISITPVDGIITIPTNLYRRKKNGVLRKISFTVPHGHLRDLVGCNASVRLQYDGREIYITRNL